MIDAGLDVQVYSYSRGLYEVNKFDNGVAVTDLGHLENGSYLRRPGAMLRSYRRIRSDVIGSSEPRVYYAFGLDCALLAWRLCRSGDVLIYEIGDVRNPIDGSFWSRALATVERHLLQRVNLFVVTTPTFITENYVNVYVEVSEKSIVVENKCPPEILEAAARPDRIDVGVPLRMGFVGLLRYPQTLVALLEATASRPETVQLSIHGGGPDVDVVERYAAKYSNISYRGAFKNPNDLGPIYSQLDLNYVVYDNRDANVRMAIPNKYYESIYFGIPILAAAQTELARRVDAAGYGFVVDPQEHGFVDSFLDSISRERIVEAKKRALATRVSDLILDQAELAEAIKHLIGTKAAENA